MRLGVAAALLIATLTGRVEAAMFAGRPTNGPSPFGGAFPLEGANIRLVSEETAIRVEGDATHYRVEARYRFEGVSSAANLLFGVPVNATGDDTFARTIRLALDGGPDVGCDVHPVTTPADGALSPPAWCTAMLAIRPRDRHLLVLRYRGELDYQGQPFIGTAHVLDRHLGYLLSRAGHWAGAPSVRVTLDLSLLPGVEVVARPEPQRASLPVLGWTVDGDAVGQVRELDVSLSLRWTFRGRVAGSGFGLPTRASSVLEPAAAFAPGNVLDANPLTAWCAGGRNPWVKIDLPWAGGDGWVCGLARVAVLPGEGALPHRRAERRPQKIRLSACGDDRAIAEAVIASRPRDRGTEVVSFDVPRDAPSVLETCLRITLVSAGGPSCLSEIIPSVSCVMLLR